MVAVASPLALSGAFIVASIALSVYYVTLLKNLKKLQKHVMENIKINEENRCNVFSEFDQEESQQDEKQEQRRREQQRAIFEKSLIVLNDETLIKLYNEIKEIERKKEELFSKINSLKNELLGREIRLGDPLRASIGDKRAGLLLTLIFSGATYLLIVDPSTAPWIINLLVGVFIPVLYKAVKVARAQWNEVNQKHNALMQSLKEYSELVKKCSENVEKFKEGVESKFRDIAERSEETKTSVMAFGSMARVFTAARGVPLRGAVILVLPQSQAQEIQGKRET